MSSPWSGQNAPMSSEQRALSSIYKSANDGTRDFQANIRDLNQSVSYMSQYLTIMQKGIDDANKNILQKIQDFIEDLIIIFGGGEYGDSGFEWGDLGYIIQAIGALFGFQGIAGPINLLEAAAHFLGNFLEPLGLFGDIVNGFIKTVFAFFADLLSNVPIVGDALEEIVTNVANGINETTTTADSAMATATDAGITANTAYTISIAAQENAGDAVDTAEAAANAAAAADTKADQAYEAASYWEAECVVASAGVLLGVNELLIGLCQNVPTGKTRRITDLHFALQTNPGGVTIETRKWNAAGTSSSLVHTATLGTNVTRINYNNLTIDVLDKERIYWHVTAVGVVSGSYANVLQNLMFGVIL